MRQDRESFAAPLRVPLRLLWGVERDVGAELTVDHFQPSLPRRLGRAGQLGLLLPSL